MAESEEVVKSFHLVPEDDPDYCDNGNGTHRPWYFHYTCHHGFDESVEDPAGQLDEQSSWPAEREEFSDQLMRTERRR